METTGRFRAANWSRLHHPRSSDCSGKWLEGEQQKKSGSSKMGADFANSATTGGRMDKRLGLGVKRFRILRPTSSLMIQELADRGHPARKNGLTTGQHYTNTEGYVDSH